MDKLLTGTECVRLLHSDGSQLDDRALRAIALKYCQRYHEIYWFEELDDVHEFLAEYGAEPIGWPPEFAALVQHDVEIAMVEYCVSLNEVSEAIYRLFQHAAYTPGDLVTTISHVWSAFACNEAPDEFVEREDLVVTELIRQRLPPEHE